MPSRSFLIAAFLVILGTAYAAYWHLMAYRLEQGIERWAEQQRAQGVEAGWRELTFDGFPLQFRARLSAPRLIQERGGNAWSWQAESLTLEALPWQLHKIAFTSDGKQAALLNGRELAFDRAEGTLSLDGSGRIAEADATLSRLALAPGAGLQGATAETLRLAARLPEEAPRGHTDPGLFVEADLSGLAIASRQALPVEGPADLSFRATLMGALPTPPDRTRLAAWRDAGGTLEIESLSLDWAPLSLDASGTLALDPALQPVGALSATLSGHGPLLQRLVAMGWVRPQDASIAAVAFGLLEKPGSDGRPTLNAPVTVQDGFLYIGPARLAPVPRIAWR
ncbi:DUF2125 domain-containing protein [Oceanibaculum sp.]|uniref:DUF2125 domain-containing protein n=1 Tax=Oceanibaculum sp. TaxID=1903597 RepID=UPI002589FF94|nr:DUF2125 domain-containing protein [Oceanibaculum sp.]MCH2393257.1 DUF2125 domain-containing protein [Oceanibaculum sp.]